ncbi:hypothetical protein [Clostridium sp.]|uniref:hypothetical protein n=1 Tax=Clostridium sp. TaxID=1506 RepID=UPI00290AA8D9|nr:hypothetical protein [Clostridium sp.]MDU4480105.1 hypothetical protein [Clostridium sp.]
MNFKLNKSLFEILNNVPDVVEYLKDINEDNNHVIFKINQDDVQEVQLLINDEIVLHGMDNQETVNDLGIKFYKLYDEILYQKKNNK